MTSTISCPIYTGPLTSDLTERKAAPQQVATTPLSELFHSIRDVLDSEIRQGFKVGSDQPKESFDRTSTAIRALLTTYGSAGHADWREFAYFNDVHYVRNLVDANDDFELIVLCWAPGQRSRIHNHASSHCFVLGLQGEIEEVQYQTPGAGESEAPKQLAVHTVRPGDTTYINDHMCLHTVGCPSTVPAPGAVTLHLYVPPIRKVDIYSGEDGSVTNRVPGFYSIRGVRT